MIAEVHGARKLPWTFRKKFQNFFSSYLTQEDLSRFGREHVMMDYYLEFVFPEKQIRYIAVTENEDTEKGLSDFVPFKNLFNDNTA